MRPGQQNKQRMRGRGRKGPNPMSRSYESNGPDVKIRGNAQHIAEKYIALARDATASGDRVMAENYLQHAEHYGRIVAAAQGVFQLQREETDFEGEYEEDGDESLQESGAPNGHPYPVPERSGGGERQQPQPQPNQMQRDRDYTGGRDYNRDQNRDYQNREQRFNRDGQNRDGQNRDAQPRENQNRDGQPREFQGRERNRDFNRDRRDYNRDNQNRTGSGGDDRRSFENRGERQNYQDRNERQTPGGLGPQPVIDEAPAGDDYIPTARPRGGERREEHHPVEAETVANEPVAAQESGFGRAAAAPELMAEPEGSIVPAEEAAAEPRRRTRQRRPRLSDGMVDVPPPADAEATAPAAETPAAPAEGVSTEAANDAPAAKRPRGRPRKKKADDENGGEGENAGLPDFLLASNG